VYLTETRFCFPDGNRTRERFCALFERVRLFLAALHNMSLNIDNPALFATLGSSFQPKLVLSREECAARDGACRVELARPDPDNRHDRG
jgi:hypothetical protein